MERYMIETDNDSAVGFLRHGEKYLEYFAPFFTLDFPDLKEEDFDEFILWADQSANFVDLNEPEYFFTIAYWDNSFLKTMNVPEKLKPIFKALVKYGKNLNKDRNDGDKTIPCLRLWIPKK